MKIEAGKYYRTRSGLRVGPAVIDNPEGRYRWNIPLDGEPDCASIKMEKM